MDLVPVIKPIPDTVIEGTAPPDHQEEHMSPPHHKTNYIIDPGSFIDGDGELVSAATIATPSVSGAKLARIDHSQACS